MGGIRKSIISKCLWLFMAVTIFNFSIDSPDNCPDCIPEDLSQNDMESVVELVMEDFLSMDNAIPEWDEHDGCDECNSDLAENGLLYPIQLSKPLNYPNSINRQKQLILSDQLFELSYFSEVLNPPPEA